MHRSLFVPGKDELDVRSVHDGVENVQHGPAGVAEDVPDAFAPQRLDECVCSRYLLHACLILKPLDLNSLQNP